MSHLVKSLSRVRLFTTPWTVAYQPPPSMGFSRQDYWSGLPFPSPGDLPNPGIEPESPALQADCNAAEALTSQPPGKPRLIIVTNYKRLSVLNIVALKLVLYLKASIIKMKLLSRAESKRQRHIFYIYSFLCPSAHHI